MKTVEIFDPALCCSTGVCGPSPDTKLAAFAGLLKQWEGRAKFQRYNLSQEPAAFVKNAVVNKILADEGADALPVILIDGELVMKKVYPTGEQLETWLEEGSCCGGDDAEEKSDCCSGSTGCC